MSESRKNILRLTEPVSVNEQTSLSLGQYIDLVAEVPLPAQQQKHDFAIYVSHAHSWYKHLPPYPPGVPFCFFIDKYAGCDRVLQQEGTLKIAEREKTGFHYADIPTERYRNRFGYLAFACGAGTTVVHRGEGPIVVPRDKIPGALHNDAVMYGLPKEIMGAGTIHLTAVIHALSASYLIWDLGGPHTASNEGQFTIPSSDLWLAMSSFEGS